MSTGGGILQNLWTTFLTILVYLSSFLGLTPSAATGGAQGSAPSYGGGSPITPAVVNYASGVEVMAYYMERTPGDMQPYNSLLKASPALTTIIPFSYNADATGRISGTVNQRMLALARARGLKVLALVHNAGDGRFSASTAHALLGTAWSRRTVIENVYDLLVHNGFDGVNIDLENVPTGDRANLTAFFRDLSARLRPDHFLVTASLPAKTYDDHASSWSGAYDYAALVPYLDLALLMTYDEHSAGGHPGPVASFGWVERVIGYAESVFSPQRIVLGVPAYGYAWSGVTGKAITHGQAASLLVSRGITPSWDAWAQVPYFQYNDQGLLHNVWYENGASAAVKAALARRHGLRGVAVWRLGSEDPAVWSEIARLWQ